MSILSVQDISKSFKLRKVVKNLSLEIKSGEVIGRPDTGRQWHDIARWSGSDRSADAQACETRSWLPTSGGVDIS